MATAKFSSTATFDIKPGDFQKHIKALAALDPNKLERIFTSAMRSAGRPIAIEMKKLAPVGKTGELKSSIVVRVYRVANTGSRNGKVHARVRIGPSARQGRVGGRYAHLVELGTAGGKRISRKKEFRIFGKARRSTPGRLITQDPGHSHSFGLPLITSTRRQMKRSERS